MNLLGGRGSMSWRLEWRNMGWHRWLWMISWTSSNVPVNLPTFCTELHWNIPAGVVLPKASQCGLFAGWYHRREPCQRRKAQYYRRQLLLLHRCWIAQGQHGLVTGVDQPLEFPKFPSPVHELKCHMVPPCATMCHHVPPPFWVPLWVDEASPLAICLTRG